MSLKELEEVFHSPKDRLAVTTEDHGVFKGVQRVRKLRTVLDSGVQNWQLAQYVRFLRRTEGDAEGLRDMGW